LNANRGVEAGIEIGCPSEHLRGEVIFLDSSSRMIQRLFGEESKQIAQRFGAMQHGTGDYFVDFGEFGFAIDVVNPLQPP
jgi:hypothetical protein